MATKLSSDKTDKINYDNFWQGQGKGSIEEEVVPGLTDSTLTASNLAMLPNGANSNEALKLTEYETKLNRVFLSTDEI